MQNTHDPKVVRAIELRLFILVETNVYIQILYVFWNMFSIRIAFLAKHFIRVLTLLHRLAG